MNDESMQIGPDGAIFLHDKPAGWSSFDSVKRLRGMLARSQKQSNHNLAIIEGENIPKKRRVKVGHAGTLDPFATGLMILLAGKMTKRADQFLKQDKTYQVEMHLGAHSTTGDPEGEVTINKSEPQSTLDQINQAMNKLTGEISQIPPAYSAIKINGQRAYKLAREGKEVIMPARNVTIYEYSDVQYDYPAVRFSVTVSSGTYIRTLVQDIAAAAGATAYTTALRRTRIGEYSLDQLQSDAQFSAVAQSS